MKAIVIFILFGVAVLWSCSPSTRITASWVDPSAKNQIASGKTVFIASLTRNLEVRSKLEDALARQAEARQIRVIKSSDHFRPDFYQRIPAERDLLAQIRQTGANAILTVSLIDTKSETRYVPGTRTYAPFSAYRWYGGFYSYYSYWQPSFYDPGYYVSDKTYFLETNLYSVENNQLIWSAQSETLNPESIDHFVNTYPKVLIAQLVKDGLLAE